MKMTFMRLTMNKTADITLENNTGYSLTATLLIEREVAHATNKALVRSR